jgi:HAD superfamily hydrolase (TIGR01509 family)
MPTPPGLVIFDCDGVLVDSERIAIQIDIEVLAELGWVLSRDEVIERFVGRSDDDVTRTIEAHLGRPLEANWADQFEPRYRQALAAELTVVDGILDVLAAVDAAGIPSCVASNGSHAKIEHSLGLTGLRDRFGGQVFSADDVACGKPAPDLFLHAARTMGVAPNRCAVVEDSRFGIEAARTAGMRGFGYGGGVTPAAWLEGPDTIVFEHMDELTGLLLGDVLPGDAVAAT